MLWTAIPGEVVPIYWKTPEDGVVVADDWATGFVQAIALRGDAWLPLLRDKDASLLLMPILTLSGTTIEEAGSVIDQDQDAAL